MNNRKDSPKFIHTIGFNVFSDDLNVIPIRSDATKVINTISPNSYGITTKDTDFEGALKSTDYLVLDGVYFSLAGIMLEGSNIKRNQGPDVFYHFMQRLKDMHGKVFFLGSAQKTLDKIAERMTVEYPEIFARYYSPPFKDVFTKEENDAMVNEINAFNPDVLFVGMTCPKQEKWSIANKDNIKAGLIISIGNVFDWFAGTQKIIHPIWFKLRIGWLVRIFLRPEIFRRNIGNQMKFFSDVLLIFLRLKKIKYD